MAKLSQAKESKASALAEFSFIFDFPHPHPPGQVPNLKLEIKLSKTILTKQRQ